jgi:hypothetical protein
MSAAATLEKPASPFAVGAELTETMLAELENSRDQLQIVPDSIGEEVGRRHYYTYPSGFRTYTHTRCFVPRGVLLAYRGQAAREGGAIPVADLELSDQELGEKLEEEHPFAEVGFGNVFEDPRRQLFVANEFDLSVVLTDDCAQDYREEVWD